MQSVPFLRHELSFKREKEPYFGFYEGMRPIYRINPRWIFLDEPLFWVSSRVNECLEGAPIWYLLDMKCILLHVKFGAG